MTWLERILGRTIDTTAALGAFAVFLMMVHVTIDVIARYVFQHALPGTLVFVANYDMVIVSFISLAFAERKCGHISVEIAVEHLPRRVQNKTNLLASLLSLAVFAMLGWTSLTEASRKFASGAFILEQDLRIPVWPSHYILPIGAGLMCLTLAFKIVRQITTREAKTVMDPF